MFNTLLGNDWTTVWFNAAFNIFVKASIVLIIPLIINFLRKKSAAEFRHLLLFLSVLILILLPFLPGPIFTFKFPIFQQDWNYQKDDLLITSITPSSSGLNDFNSVAPSKVSNTLSYLESNNNPEIGYYLAVFTFSIWLAGSIYLIAHLLIGIIGVYHIKKSITSFSDQEWANILENLCCDLKLNRSIRLFSGNKFQTPFTFGIIRPFIYLPNSLKNWSMERRQCVLLHELSHIKRRDTLTYLIARFVVALYWLNPLAWIALRALRLEQEEACDDRVLNYGIKPSDYASHLLDFLKERRPAHPVAALGVSSFKTIKSRIGQILNPLQKRSPLNIKMCITVIIMAVFSIMTITIFGPVVAATESSLPSPIIKQVEYLQPKQPELSDTPSLDISKTNINYINSPVQNSSKVNIEFQTEDQTVSASDIPSLMPISGNITASFGIRYHPKLKEEKLHTGIDIETSIGTPVRSAANGIVQKAQFSGAYGLMVIVAHKGDISTVNAHLSQMSVKPGQTITLGETLGFSGDTGQTIGPHLHYEIQIKGQPVNPLFFINQNNTLAGLKSETVSQSTENQTESNFNLLKPVPIAKISSPFGWGIDPFTKKSRFHSGIDIPLPTSTPIQASADGQVVKAEPSGNYGILVIITHQNNYTTYYAKLSQALVKAGDTVKQGDIIAYSGNTGRTTGPHLHFEVRNQDRPVNPMLLLKLKNESR